MKSVRALIPVIFFGALTIFCVAYGLYYVGLCVREIIHTDATAWRYFLSAEFALLFAWNILGWTRISLAIRRGTVKNEQVTIKGGTGGTVGRLMFFVALGAAAFVYLTLKFFYYDNLPWWFKHLGHVVIAILMFCGFTYPWRRRSHITGVEK
jgi:hypothetical protein